MFQNKSSLLESVTATHTPEITECFGLGRTLKMPFLLFCCPGEALKRLSYCGKLIHEFHLAIEAGKGGLQFSCHAMASLQPIKHCRVTQPFLTALLQPLGLETQIKPPSEHSFRAHK